jgi:hypothetical protein
MQKKENVFPADGGGVWQCAAFASNDSLAGGAEDLGLFLLPNGRPGAPFYWCGRRSDIHGSRFGFLLAAARATASTLFHHDTSV